MARAIDRFQELVASSGINVALARSVSRLLDLTGQRLQLAGRRFVDPATVESYLPRSIADQLAYNKVFRGKHLGRRALLLGSGDSSANVNRNVIGDRAVIAVNEMFRPVMAAKLPLTAIVIQDATYFDGSASTRQMVTDAANAAREADAVVVVPANHVQPLIDSGILGRERALTFFESGRPIHGLARPPCLLDLANVIPSLPTVAHAALAAALYMGFSEVAILGVDLTYVVRPNDPISHSYGQNPYLSDLDALTAAEVYSRNCGWAWSAVLRHVASQLDDYQWLAEGARAEGRRVLNLSNQSLLSTVRSIEQDFL